MNKFGILLKKELRELITPQAIVPLLVVVVMFIGLGKIIGAQSHKLQQPQAIVVVDNDNSAASAQVPGLLAQANFRPEVRHNVLLPAINFKTETAKAILIIPAGFARDLAQHKSVQLQSYTLQTSFSLAGSVNAGLATKAQQVLNAAFGDAQISSVQPKANPESIRNPIQLNPHLVVGNEAAAVDPSQVSAYLASQITLVPIVLFIVILFASQMIATTMANEKENKTLETLLSAPVSRESIVGAKMLAAAIVAGLSALIYMIGLRSYTSGFSSGTVSPAVKQAVAQLHLVFTPAGYLLLGASLFLAILAALAIALILGSFAENVKSVQALITPLMVLLLVPYIATMMVDLSIMPAVVRWIIYAIPFSYPFLALSHIFLHEYALVFAGLVYQFVFFGAALMVAARIFASDRILTLNLNFRKRGAR